MICKAWTGIRTLPRSDGVTWGQLTSPHIDVLVHNMGRGDDEAG